MAELKGTKVASRIVPSDTLDEYATHDADFGRGGYRSVADIIERDSIPEPRRKAGMKVFVNSENKEYTLQDGINNIHWVSGTGSSSTNINSTGTLSATGTLPSTYITFIDAMVANIEVTLPSHTEGLTINLKRIDTSNNYVIILDEIDGEANARIDSHENFKLISHNSKWYII